MIATGDYILQPPAFAQRITALRKDRGLTVKEFARHVGIFWTFMYQIESGARTPSLETLETIAIALGTTTSDLMFE